MKTILLKDLEKLNAKLPQGAQKEIAAKLGISVYTVNRHFCGHIEIAGISDMRYIRQDIYDLAVDLIRSKSKRAEAKKTSKEIAGL